MSALALELPIVDQTPTDLVCDQIHPYKNTIAELSETVPILHPYNTLEPTTSENCSYTFVTTPDDLESMVHELATGPRFAVDMEAHSQHTYSGTTCLIKISTGGTRLSSLSLALYKATSEKKLTAHLRCSPPTPTHQFDYVQLSLQDPRTIL